MTTKPAKRWTPDEEATIRGIFPQAIIDHHTLPVLIARARKSKARALRTIAAEQSPFRRNGTSKAIAP